MDTPRYRAILRHQLGWAFVRPLSEKTDIYIDRDKNHQYVPKVESFADDDEIIEYLTDKGCSVEALSDSG